MGRKKKQIVNLKPFCFYCDKEFNNELILHQHQKSRHFNCIKCKKRFSTAPALDTHYFQFHQEKLKSVPNAKRGRDTFDISIYGMDGVPIELIQYKLAEKVEKKRKKIYNEELKKIKEKNKIDNNNNNNIEIEKKEKKDKILKYLESKNDEIDKLLHSNNLTGQFYHNPNSINLTMKQKQMTQMYLNKNLNDDNNNNNNNDNNNEKNNINNILNQINNNIQENNKSYNINNDNNDNNNNIEITNNNKENDINNNDNNNDNIDINNLNNNIDNNNNNNDYKMEEDNVD